ncbi:MAG: hypothetical protein ACYSVY_00925 [Planctomycetota bacterium]
MQQQGKLQMLGIIQEQHPERCRLFMQWKQVDWPVLTDPLNLLGVGVVPITLAIDERGVVRAVLRKPDQLKHFVDQPPPQAGPAPAVAVAAPDLDRLRPSADSSDADAWRAYADALILWGGPQHLDAAIEAYSRALPTHPQTGPTRFRLGVAYRMRHDSAVGRPGDFTNAVAFWQAALDADPNNYIWRRRIQQYGPRLDKPYSFYDWIHTARTEIKTRGQTPAQLAVEPGGAEFAQPARTFSAAPKPPEPPDPGGRIERDPGRLIQVEITLVPSVVAPAETVRVHLTLRPNPKTQAHWNNESGDLTLWLDLPEGWGVDRSILSVPNPRQPLSREMRRIEFELKCPPTAEAAVNKIPAYALYYVCEDRTGKCLYRRQDLPIHVAARPLKPNPPSLR